ncbi:MAG: NifB/NifX family molybdenum-iron cluster-binding protein [Candidatus Weimeria sp.]
MRKKKDRSFDFVAVAYAGGASIPYFEKAEYFNIIFFEEGKRRKKGHMLLMGDKNSEEAVDTLKKEMTDKVIARNFGPRALFLLTKAGIKAYSFQGGSGAALKALEKGELTPMN